MLKTEIGTYTLEIFEDTTYCPISHEHEPIIRFNLSHVHEGEKIILENESINLEILLIERDNLADKCFDLNWSVEYDKRNVQKLLPNAYLQKRIDYTLIRFLYFSFMLQYVKGLLSHA